MAISVIQLVEQGIAGSGPKETYLENSDIIPNFNGYIHDPEIKRPIAINTQMWKKAEVKGRNLHIFPGIGQLTTPFLQKKVDVNAKYMELFAGEEDNLDLSGRYQALASWQHPYKYINAPILDVTAFRNELKLGSLCDFEKRFFKYMIEQFFARGSYRNVYVNGKSSTGAPLFIYDKEFKTKLSLIAIDHLERIAQLWMQGDYDALLQDFYMLPILVGGVRIQPDKIKYKEETKSFYSKDRMTPDLLWLRTMGKSGSLLKANVEPIPVEGRATPIQGSRVRRMYPPNSIMGHLVAPLHNYLYEGYCKFVKIADYHGPESVLARAEEKYNTSKMYAKKSSTLLLSYIERSNKGKFLSIDKSSFDTTLSYERLQIDVLTVLDNVSPELGALYALSYAAPVLVKEFETGNNQFILTRDLRAGNQLLTSHRFRNSLMSGHPFVSLQGKENGVDDLGILLSRFLLWLFEKDSTRFWAQAVAPDINFTEVWTSFEEYKHLRNKILQDELNLITCFTFGDDTMLYFVCSELDNLFREFFGSYDKFIHNDELEELPLFLGYYYEPFAFHKSIGKLIENLNGSERSYTKKLFPQLGVHARYEEYLRCKNPYLQDVWKIECEAYKELDFDLEGYRNKGKLVEALLNTGDFGANAQFIQNPETIFYKVDAEKVNPELLNEVYASITAEKQEQIYKYHIGTRVS